MALAVPDAFESTGWAFGLGYFVVNLVHSGLFLLSGGPAALAANAVTGPAQPTHGKRLSWSADSQPTAWQVRTVGAGARRYKSPRRTCRRSVGSRSQPAISSSANGL